MINAAVHYEAKWIIHVLQLFVFICVIIPFVLLDIRKQNQQVFQKKHFNFIYKPFPSFYLNRSTYLMIIRNDKQRYTWFTEYSLISLKRLSYISIFDECKWLIWRTLGSWEEMSYRKEICHWIYTKISGS